MVRIVVLLLVEKGEVSPGYKTSSIIFGIARYFDSSAAAILEYACGDIVADSVDSHQA